MNRLLQIEKRERKKLPRSNQSVKTEGKFRALSQRGGGEKKKTKLLVTETDEPALHNFVGNYGFFPIGERIQDFSFKTFK